MKPSFSATAYATADSKPSPLVGSFLENHGSYAGESVPIVSVPGVRTASAAQAAGSASADAEVGLAGRRVLARVGGAAVDRGAAEREEQERGHPEGQETGTDSHARIVDPTC